MIYRLQNGDSLNITLNATAPLYQTFKKGTDEYTPNWATMPDADRPVIYPRSYSVMEAQVKAVTNIAWKYNNVAMTFDANGLCTAPDIAAGKVRQIDYNGTKALKMIGNVASDTNNDSDMISFFGKVRTDGQDIDVSAETTLLIEEAAANLYRLFLNMTDDVIDGDETSLQMTASLYNMGTAVTSGAEFEFTDIAGNVLRAKGSSPVFTVTRGMIDSSLMVTCKAYVGGIVVAMEHRQVWDSSDGVALVCNHGARKGQTTHETIDYIFWIINSRTGSTVPGATFEYKVINTLDKSEITSDFAITGDTVTVTPANINQYESFYIWVKGEVSI